MRSSQINGCAYCLDMHSKDAIAIGESVQRLHVLAAWREAPFYSPKEIMELSFAILTINCWNRLAIGLTQEVGGYISNRKPQ